MNGRAVPGKRGGGQVVAWRDRPRGRLSPSSVRPATPATPRQLSVFSYTEMRGKLLLDDRYVLEPRLNDAVFKDKLRRFVRASMTGGPMPRTIPKRPPTS